ncbi:Glyoxylase, beta-lactamase superfamily II [Geosporobacter subterraneus DSM 17957]|uniref:Glyoxylase, beta-lactamase superfamily II n=1 Tax=Geosporobacter subterraneus DSM 17957 TaxID=1121919 RepID=A0A1M6F8Q1_9FIRM|nr:MBL fold metallo-hydrolase [Geosporobacter subterraneus]SHI93979.1 Glyoxylase, beta-lactamase superfamily II [Geosporobacter subterraneus DSM 17957]
MKEMIAIAEGIRQYIFVEDEDKSLMDVNITVLVDGKRALLIDTAYPEQASRVLELLHQEGITPDEIILSHYHPDHAAGAHVFEKANLSCSMHYEENYQKCSEIWDPENTYLKPNRLVKDQNEQNFGPFHISFFHAPGHCKCSLITVINKEIAHCGDLVMQASDDRPALPYLCRDGDYQEHIDSLERLKFLDLKQLILPHGRPILGKDQIHHAIDARIHYLKKVLESKGKLAVEECLYGEAEDWAFLNYHKDNITLLDKV